MSGCLLCGSKRKHVLSNICRYRIPRENVVCKTCGLVYIPRGGESLPAYDSGAYREQYRVHDLDGAEYRRVKRVKAGGLVSFVPDGGRVLEIGCANGVLLHEIRALRGCEVLGIEPDRALAARARDEFGINVFPGTLDGYRETGTFDLIILEHVLEHFDDPLAALAAVRRLLSPGGSAYIEVPDIRAPYGDLDLNFFQHAHLYSFSAKTLGIALRLSGLKRQGCYGDGGCIALVCRRGDSVGREQIDFEIEGEDWRTIAKYLALYKHNYRAGAAGRAGNRQAFYAKAGAIDIELEKKMVSLRLGSLRDECMLHLDGNDFGGALRCITEYYRVLGSNPGEIAEMLVLGKLLAEKNGRLELSGQFAALMKRIHDGMEQAIGGSDENIGNGRSGKRQNSSHGAAAGRKEGMERQQALEPV